MISPSLSPFPDAGAGGCGCGCVAPPVELNGAGGACGACGLKPLVGPEVPPVPVVPVDVPVPADVDGRFARPSETVSETLVPVRTRPDLPAVMTRPAATVDEYARLTLPALRPRLTRRDFASVSVRFLTAGTIVSL